MSEGSESQRRGDADERVQFTLSGPLVSITLQAHGGANDLDELATAYTTSANAVGHAVAASAADRAETAAPTADHSAAAELNAVAAAQNGAAVQNGAAAVNGTATDAGGSTAIETDTTSPGDSVVDTAASSADSSSDVSEQPGTTAPGGDDAAAEIDLAAPASSVVRTPEPAVVPLEEDRTGALVRTIASSRVKATLVASDVWAIAVGMVAAAALAQVFELGREHNLWRTLLLFGVSLPVWVLGISVSKGYLARANVWLRHELRNMATGAVIGTASVIGLAFAVGFDALSRVVTALTFGCTLLMLGLNRLAARQVFRRLRRAGRMRRRIVVVGTDPHAISLMHGFQRRPDLGYEVVGFVGNDDIGDRGGVRVLGGYEDVDKVLERTSASGVVVSLAAVSDRMVNDMTRQLTDGGYHVTLSTSLRDIDVTRLRPQIHDGRTMIYVEPTIRTGWRKFAKRLFDVSAAATMILLTAPIMLLSLIAIRVDSRGPLFFRQIRLGKDGQEFKIIKLRTMVADAERRKHELMVHNESDGPLFKMKRDPRITRVGRILRKTSIDELPQLWNVLTGDMSLVGPRPALPSEAESWTEELHDRLRVLPGITGMWQVYGRSEASFEEYKRLDLYYVDNWSLLHDLRIVARTVYVVLAGKGAS